VIGHIAPEAANGGPIALIQEGDILTINAEERTINADIDWAARRAAFVQPPINRLGGAYDKFARLVSSAAHGAVTSKVFD
jgi:dihydroxy-acid dehydratase